MTDMTNNEIEIDSFTRPEDIVASIGKKVRIHYHPDVNGALEDRVGWVVDGGGQRGWGVAARRDADHPEWRLFNSDDRPESGLWSGIARVALLEDQEASIAEQEAFIAEQKIEQRVTLARMIGMDDERRNMQRRVKWWWFDNVDDLDESVAATVTSLIEEMGLSVPEPKDREITVRVAFKFTARAVDFAAERELEDSTDMTITDSVDGLDMVALDDSRFVSDSWQPPQYEITEITVEDA